MRAYTAPPLYWLHQFDANIEDKMVMLPPNSGWFSSDVVLIAPPECWAWLEVNIEDATVTLFSPAQ
jgi:hypothetical protein